LFHTIVIRKARRCTPPLTLLETDKLLAESPANMVLMRMLSGAQRKNFGLGANSKHYLDELVPNPKKKKKKKTVLLSLVKHWKRP
jgi:hypothetical protein